MVATLVSSRIAYHIAMDTTLTIEVPGDPPGAAEHISRAFQWFDEVERVCTRFDPSSELRRLCDQPGVPVIVSELLFSLLQFALGVAAESHGAFDPTVGGAVARAGFNRNYRTGELSSTASVSDASYRDVVLKPESREVLLLRPLTLDLGAVAKGFAIDLAAHELEGYENFAVNAGGDLFVNGESGDGGPWRIGVRDPRDFDALAETFALGGMAICTSGDYERRHEATGVHHLFDGRTGKVSNACASVSVIAPTAMVADALATAAFALGQREGVTFLEAQGVEGLVITSNGERFETSGLREFIA